MDKRGSGILLHITSLPSVYGIGDFGPDAYHFSDFLCHARQKYWQILPLTPTDTAHGNSPYHSNSAFAVNPILVSPELLLKDAWIGHEDIEGIPLSGSSRVNYDSVSIFKNNLLKKAYQTLKTRGVFNDLERFCEENAFWLNDFSLFVTLKTHFNGKAWFQWPTEFRDRRPDALAWARQEFEDSIQFVCFTQYLLFQQWFGIKQYCNEHGIRIFGDIPIYMVHDSADVWVHPEMFNLDENRMPVTVAGVPPDYFSNTGQLWGNPVYRWDVLKQNGFHWWLERMGHNLRLYDVVRIDHFRGLVAYWEVPAYEKNAINGRWVEAPVWDFLKTITERFPNAPIVAEDLGVITPDVVEVIRHFGFPGMKILLFAFGDDLPSNPYAPHNLERNCIVYTGTHDNNTARGWFEKEASVETRTNLCNYLGKNISPEGIGLDLIRLSMMSVADTDIFPIQALLGMDEDARMNRPATANGNWEWRLEKDMLTPVLADHLKKMTEIYGRA